MSRRTINSPAVGSGDAEPVGGEGINPTVITPVERHIPLNVALWGVR
ncbi:hypothetical protein ACTG9Q_31345 [Actinokineospora sp. 24-640]